MNAKTSLKHDDNPGSADDPADQALRDSLDQFAERLLNFARIIDEAGTQLDIAVPPQFHETLCAVLSELQQGEHNLESASELLLRLRQPLRSWNDSLKQSLRERKGHSTSTVEELFPR
ncbi:MAG: hypothetical protein MPJ78_11775 [Hyphomicrobiaceae bacterium]|nr:hypothetical protein [Hyphomicrobiaceae bacterium]